MQRKKSPIRIEDDWLGCIVGLLLFLAVAVLPGLLS